MIAAEIVAGVVLATQFSEYGINLPHNASVGILVVICVFIAGFAWCALEQIAGLCQVSYGILVRQLHEGMMRGT